MKKIFILVLIIFLFLCSCSKMNKNYDFMIEDTSEFPYVVDITQTKYIMSAKGSTYHLEHCYIVKNMKEENIREFYGKQFFIDREISPCKICKP